MNTEIIYQRELGKNYVIIESHEKQNNYVSRIINENSIESLLPVTYSVIDNKAAYKYDISGYHSLDSLYRSKQMTSEEIGKIIAEISQLPQELEPFLLDYNHILLGPETIFVNDYSGLIGLCYYPEEENFSEGLKRLAAFFMRKANHEDEASSKMVYEFFELSDKENTDPGIFSRIIQVKTPDIEDTPVIKQAASSGDNDEMDLLLDFDEEIFADDDDIFDDEINVEKVEKKKTDTRKILAILTPLAITALSGAVLFSSLMSDLSVALRVVSLVLMLIAFSFISLLFYQKKTIKEK